MTSHLFDPLTIRGTTFKNRAWVSPMCMYQSKDGVIGEFHHAHLGALVTGGSGLVIAEAKKANGMTLNDNDLFWLEQNKVGFFTKVKTYIKSIFKK